MPGVKIDELLAPGQRRHTRLQRLLDQAASQDAWTRELRAVLPDPLASACRVTAVRGTTLVVACADGASATRLRFLVPDIIERLKVLAHYRQIERVELRIARQSDRLPG